AVAVPGRVDTFVMLEDLIAANLESLFPGVEVLSSHLFRVVRDADIEIKQLESADLISAIELTLKLRRFGDPVQLEFHSSLDSRWSAVLHRGLKLYDEEIFVLDCQLGMDLLWEIASVDRSDFEFSPHNPFVHEELRSSDKSFDMPREKDVLLHHPYDRF